MILVPYRVPDEHIVWFTIFLFNIISVIILVTLIALFLKYTYKVFISSELLSFSVLIHQRYLKMHPFQPLSTSF